MKRILAIAACVIIASFCLVGCGGGSDSPYVGTYTATVCEYAGIEMDVESILGGPMVVEIEANGDATVDAAGDIGEGSWEEIEGGVLIDGEVEMYIEGDVATMEMDGVTFTFER